MDIKLITKTVNDTYKDGALKGLYRYHSYCLSDEYYNEIKFNYDQGFITCWEFHNSILGKGVYSPKNFTGRIYPFQVSSFFPYPKGEGLWQNDMGMGLWNPDLAIDPEADVKSIYAGIKEAYDFNCDFIGKRMKLASLFFEDMNNIMGLGDVQPLDLVKKSVELFAPYSDKAQEFLDHFDEGYEYNRRLTNISRVHAYIALDIIRANIKSLEDK